MPEKIYVDTAEELQRLLDEGVASQGDWEDWADAVCGQGPPWPGWIYPNVVSSVTASAGSEIARLISLGSALTEDDFEEFSFCGCAFEFGNTCHDDNGRFCGLAGSPSESGPFFTGHKGRTIAEGQKVKVYRNLHKPGVVYSIQDAKTGLVLGHSSSVALKNVTYEVHEAGRQRVIKEKKKNVHSFVVGEYHGPFTAADRKGALSGEPVSYNPYKSGSYYSKVDQRDVSGADSVIVDQSGVYMKGERKSKLRKLTASAFAAWQFANTKHKPAGTPEGGEFAPKWVGEAGGITLASLSDRPIEVVGNRLATAKPSAVGSDYKVGSGASMGLGLVTDEQLVDKKSGPGLISRQAAVPGFEDIADMPESGNSDISAEAERRAIVEEIVRRQTDNIVALTDRVMTAAPKEAAATADWYPWANKWTGALAEENGLSHQGVIGATAALSASAAWDSNVPWAKFLAENLATNKGPGKGANQKVDPKWAMAAYLNEMSLGHKPDAEAINAMVGKPLSELSDRDTALMLRGKHDASGTWNPKTGKFMKGEVRKLGEGYHAGLGTAGDGTVPQSVDNFAKAISALRDPSDANIDVALGKQNKVRSFYQNMRDPLDTAGTADITVDTHHLGLSNGIPFTVSSRFLNKQDIINTPSNAKTGALGSYALVVEATRRATAILNKKHGTNYAPNQIQSIAWEAWKDYYSPKSRSNATMQDSIEKAQSAYALYVKTGGKEGVSKNERDARIEAARIKAGNVPVTDLYK